MPGRPAFVHTPVRSGGAASAAALAMAPATDSPMTTARAERGESFDMILCSPGTVGRGARRFLLEPDCRQKFPALLELRPQAHAICRPDQVEVHGVARVLQLRR